MVEGRPGLEFHMPTRRTKGPSARYLRVVLSQTCITRETLETSNTVHHRRQDSSYNSFILQRTTRHLSHILAMPSMALKRLARKGIKQSTVICHLSHLSDSPSRYNHRLFSNNSRSLHLLRSRRMRPTPLHLLPLRNLHRATPLSALARQIPPHASKVPNQALSTFPKRVKTHSDGRTHEPNNADNDPATEEFLAEDVARAVEGHGPKDEENERHDCGGRLCDFGGAQELGLFGGFGFGGEGDVAADDLFDVEVGGGGDVGVVDETDVLHGDPVVIVCILLEREFWGLWDD